MKTMYPRLFIVLLAMTFSAIVPAQPVLDPTFSSDGFVLTKISPSKNDIARTVLVQPNGKILVGGNSLNEIGFSNAGIARLKSNGSYDNTFGTGGITTIPGGFFADMELMPNNKIIVAGSGVSAANLNNYVVYRLKSNGSLDSTFGNNGSVSVSISTGNMICYDVALQSDGKIVLGGYIDDGAGGHHTLLIVRLNRNGTLDNTFATGGKFTLNITNKGSECHQLAIQPDGKIVAGGFIDTFVVLSFFRYDFGAIRLKNNGTLDPTFGNGGVVRADKSLADEDCYATAILSDGRIVLGGFSDFSGKTQFTVLCLKNNGAPDNSFGNGGWQFIDFYGGTSLCNAMAIENGDDIILAGDVILSQPSFQKSIGLAKLQSDGTLDNTFGNGGIDTSFVTVGLEGCSDVALQPDGKIVTTGYMYVANHYSYLTARYTNSSLKVVQDVMANDMNAISAYPNPVTNGELTIQYTLATNSNVTVQLYDMNGKMVKVWHEGLRSPSVYTLSTSLPGLNKGSYIFRLVTETEMQTFKIQKAE